MIFRVADDRHLPAVGSYHVTLRDCVGCVVRSFRVNVRLERQQKLFECRLVENRDVVHGLQRGNDLGPLIGGKDWSASAFLNRDLFVCVDAYDQNIAELFGAGEVTDVSDVEHVETAIRQNDSCPGFACGCDLSYQFFAAEDVMHQSCLIECSSSLALTVAVPLFITTNPPA